MCLQGLTRRMRKALHEGQFPEFVCSFVDGHYPQVGPVWISLLML